MFDYENNNGFGSDSSYTFVEPSGYHSVEKSVEQYTKLMNAITIGVIADTVFTASTGKSFFEYIASFFKRGVDQK